MRRGLLVLVALGGCGDNIHPNRPAPRKACSPIAPAVQPGPAPRHAMGGNRLAVADLDGDRYPELVDIGSAVSISRQHAGRYTDAIEYPLGGGALDVAIGDVNGDRIPDVVVVLPVSGTIRVLAGVGDGTVSAGVDHVAGVNGPVALAIGDVTGDGVADIVVGGTDSVAVLRGPDFQTVATLMRSGPNPYYAQLVGPGGIALADVDGDGALDVVVGSSNGLTVLLARDGYSVMPTGIDDHGGAFVAVSDVDRDGKLDLILGTVRGVSVALGHGDGTFALGAEWLTGMSGYPLAVGDLDGDGVPDVASLGDHNGVVDVAHGHGDGTFDPPVQYAVGGGYPLDVAIADVDHDGLNDLVTTSFDTFGFLWGRNGMLYPNHVDYAATPSGSRATAIALGDFNEDGAVDAAVVGEPGDASAVLLGDGGGGLCPPPMSSNAHQQYGIAAGDLDGDGHLDLVVGEDSGIGVMVGDGTGNFAPEVAYGQGVLFVGGLLDLNGDGALDVVAANVFGSAVTVFLGNGNGSLQPSVDYALANGGIFLSIGDVTRDGIPDIINANYADTWQLLVGNGDGSFQPAVTFSPEPAAGATIVDVDGDGHGELVLQGTAGLLVYEYSGGTLQLTRQIPASFDSFGPFLLVADIDGDGRLDAGTYGGESAVTLVHDILGASRSELWPTGNRPDQILVAPLAQQSRPSILVTDVYGGAITVIPPF